jgi:hypothetical protein
MNVGSSIRFGSKSLLRHDRSATPRPCLSQVSRGSDQGLDQVSAGVPLDDARRRVVVDPSCDVVLCSRPRACCVLTPLLLRASCCRAAYRVRRLLQCEAREHDRDQQVSQVTTSLTSVDVHPGWLLCGVICTHLSIIDASMAMWSRLTATSSSRWPAAASAKLLCRPSVGPLRRSRPGGGWFTPRCARRRCGRGRG